MIRLVVHSRALVVLALLATIVATSASAGERFFQGAVGSRTALLTLTSASDGTAATAEFLDGGGRIKLDVTTSDSTRLALRGTDSGGHTITLNGTLDRTDLTGTMTTGGRVTAVVFHEYASSATLAWDDGPSLHVAIDYPLFDTAPRYEAMESAFHAAAVQTLQRVTAEALERRRAEREIAPLAATAYVEQFDITYATRNFVSVVTRVYEFTGGAHGNHTVSTVLYGRAAGGTVAAGDAAAASGGGAIGDAAAAGEPAYQRRSLASLFQSNVDYVSPISRALIADLGHQGALYVTNGSIDHFVQSDLGSFGVSTEGLVFYFPHYAVAPYAFGEYDSTVGWSRIADLLDPSVANALTADGVDLGQ